MREKLRELDIKITELAEYLHISRPTMYKFIESYESGRRHSISKPILGLLDYIEKTPLIGKENVISYILTNIAIMDGTLETDDAKAFKKLLNDWQGASPERKEFISKVLERQSYGNEIRFYVEIQPILSKKKLSSEEQKKVDLYKEISNKIGALYAGGSK
jgi:hypothetical protein